MGYGAPIYIDAHTPEHIIKRMKDKNELETMLGAARFKTYYTAAGNDTEKAVALYRWNTRLAGALHSQLSYFEVLTRNAMNNALQDWNYKEKGCRDWSLEYQSNQLLYDMFKTPMGQARKWARKESQRRGNGHTRKNAPPSHDDVIAQFTLGNWSNLLGEALPDHRSNAKRLWKECLHHAFPNAGIED